MEHLIIVISFLFISAYPSKKGNGIDFISIMLAKPTSLVALALYHNDFSKANQILEVSGFVIYLVDYLNVHSDDTGTKSKEILILMQC